MKKLFTAMIALLMVISLAACTSKPAEPTTPTEEPSAEVAEGKVLNVWTWNTEFWEFLGEYYADEVVDEYTLKKGDVKRIVLTRPAVEAGENLGFLPGDLKEKVDPYLTPLYDALHDMLGNEQTEKLMERGTIEVAPLAYMRGRTLNDAYVILDEAQNTTTAQMKMFLTRLGFHSRMVITGDITQIDLSHNTASGLVEAARILQGMRDIAVLELTADDVVRHPLVQKIIERYSQEENHQGGKQR